MTVKKKNNYSKKSGNKVRGRTISIYIPDSNPKSIKICDIKDSIVKAFFIPRNKLEDALKREELEQPGVYFLVGEKNEVGKPKIYIGEAETLIKRIKQHNTSSKNDEDFWNSVICFISEKKNINKAHIKYLENIAYNRAKELNKCELINENRPTQSNLTEQEKDFALSFFDDLKLLIATLGYPIFEESKIDKSKIFKINKKVNKINIEALGEYAEDGFVVFKGSHASLTESTRSRSWITNIRNNLTEKGVLKEKGDSFVFTEDYTFSSPSAAAAVVVGHEANGWKEWKDRNGKTLDERYRKTTSSSG